MSRGKRSRIIRARNRRRRKWKQFTNATTYTAGKMEFMVLKANELSASFIEMQRYTGKVVLESLFVPKGFIS